MTLTGLWIFGIILVVSAGFLGGPDWMGGVSYAAMLVLIPTTFFIWTMRLIRSIQGSN